MPPASPPPYRRLPLAALLLTLCLAPCAPAGAQAPREFVAQRLLVHNFDAARRGWGRRAADALSRAIARGARRGELEVVGRAEMLTELGKAGFNPDSALTPGEMRDLARQRRVDEFVSGRVSGAEGAGVRLDGAVTLTRDPRLAQPISASHATLEGATDAFAAEVLRARQQMVPVRRCENALRAGKARDAVAAAREGIRLYPRAAIARACLLRAASMVGEPADSILAVARALLEVDSLSAHGLEWAARSYDDLHDRAHAAEMWSRLVATNPRDTELVGRAVSALMRGGSAAVARPLIERAVAEHPENDHLAGLRWLVLLATEEWARAAEAGEALRKSSPNYETQPDFFVRLATAYRNAGDPVRAVATAAAGVALHAKDPDLYLTYVQLVSAEADSGLARGLARFPTNGRLLALDAQLRRRRGDLQGALDVTRRALASDSTLARGYLQLAQAFLDVGQPDSALVALRGGLRTAADSALVGQFALARGNALYRSATASRKREEFELALRWLELAQTTAPSPNGAFLVGAASLSVGQIAATEAFAARSCPLATLAQQSLTTAETQLAAHGDVSPDAARQLLEYAGQLRPYLAQQLRAFCGEGASANGQDGGGRPRG